METQEKQIENHADKIKILETAIRKRNLIFHNIPETENAEQSLRQIVSKIISDELKAQVKPSDLQFTYRLGKKNTSQGTDKKQEEKRVVFKIVVDGKIWNPSELDEPTEDPNKRKAAEKSLPSDTK